MIWLDYNGYKLAESQSDLTQIQALFLHLGHEDLYKQMNEVKK